MYILQFCEDSCISFLLCDVDKYQGKRVRELSALAKFVTARHMLSMHTPLNTKKTSIGARELVAMMAALMALNALAIDTKLPAFPEIRATFGIKDENATQHIISIFLLGTGLGSILYGPLSDRFGRKSVLIPAIIGYTLCSLGGSFAPNFEFLLVMRLAQELCGAAMGVLVAAIIRDQFEGDTMARHMSMIFMVFMIVPIVAPSVGAAMLTVTGWRNIFNLFAVLSIMLAIWVVRRLPETLDRANIIPIQPTAIMKGWRAVTANRMALGYVIASGIAHGSLFGYLTSSEQIFARTFGARDFFPIGFAIISIGLACANFANSRIVERFGARRVSHTAAILYICMGALQYFAAVYAPTSLWLFLALITINMALIAFLGSNFSAIAMQPFGKMAGIASSFQQSVRIILSAIIGGIIGAQYNGNVQPIAAGFFLCGIAALALVYISENGKLFTRRSAA
jgi:MFS transporter, DHA1 family, multidrug resistance protein